MLATETGIDNFFALVLYVYNLIKISKSVLKHAVIGLQSRQTMGIARYS